MSAWAFPASLVGSFAATLLLRRAAPRLGLLDPPPGAEVLDRKAQRRPAAVVGGLALAAIAVPVARWAGELSGLEALALWAAGAVGLLDDRLKRGLGPAAKLSLQLGLGLLVARATGAADALATAGWVAATLVAVNAVNTFDNSDGAAAAVAALGLCAAPTSAAAALLGFLPHNLHRPSPSSGARSPQAYLGDSGSHLLGVWIALTPAAWPALCVPLLDLARVVVLRLAAGRAPWTGDRLHLAQGLERAGWGTAARVAALVGASLPAVLGARLGGPAGLGLGVALSAAATAWLTTRAR